MKEKTEWHNIVVWGKGAEFVGEYVHKGDLIMVKAPSRTRKWQDKDGNDRYTTEIVCTRYEHLLALKTAGGGSKPAAAQSSQPGASTGQNDFSDDIPF